MKRSINELTGYTIDAVDGTKGIVRDFLFDEEEWNIRYLEADLGLIFSGRKVLIPNKFLKSPDWSSHSFPVAIDKSSIEECPELAENLPVSRRYEEELNKYYESNDYWSNTYVVPVGQPGLIHTPRPIPIPNKIIDEQEIDTSLRSFKELKGYKVIGSDGQIGQVDDIIVDDMSWQIVYLVVDTSNWMEWSKKVLISTHSMDEISYEQNEIKINLNIENIKSAPELDDSKPVNEEFEKKLYDYFGRPVKQQ